MLKDLSRGALERILLQAHPDIHHSNQGVQYAATGYASPLQAVYMQISMSARSRPTENAFAERFTRTLKEEEVSLNEYEDLADARAHIAHFLDQVSQNKRIHSSLSYLTLLSLKLTGTVVLLKQVARNVHRFMGPLQSS